MKTPMGLHSNGHAGGCGAGWATEQRTSMWVKTLLLGDTVRPDTEVRKSTHRDTEDRGTSLDRRTGGLGGKAQGTRELYLCHNFPKDGIPFVQA